MAIHVVPGPCPVNARALAAAVRTMGASVVPELGGAVVVVAGIVVVVVVELVVVVEVLVVLDVVVLDVLDSAIAITGEIGDPEGGTVVMPVGALLFV
jgi:hypothetical protein